MSKLSEELLRLDEIISSSFEMLSFNKLAILFDASPNELSNRSKSSVP